MARRFHSLLVAGLALGLLAATATAQTVTNPIDPDEPPPQASAVPIPPGQIDAAVAQLDSLAQALLERSGIPGLAVAVVRDGRTVYAKGFGVRRLGEAAAVDADTVFQLASVSKSLGATVVAHEVGAGLLTWDTPVIASLPWFALSDPWVTRQVTIGDLYAHRSGLPDHAGDELEALGYGRYEILARLRLLPLDPFRSTYAYTNFGLTAAAEAVAMASGSDWATLSQDVLYGPLGMASTSSRMDDFLARANRAQGHIRTADGFQPVDPQRSDPESPAGGASSSVNDMARWMALVLQQGRYDGQQLVADWALLPAVTPRVVTDLPATPDSRPGFYGYGFGVGIEPSGRVTVAHSGAFLLGAATTYLLLPSAGVGIVVLSNAVPIGAVEALSREFADLVQYGTVTRDWYAAYSALTAPLLAPEGALVGRQPPLDPQPALPAAAYAGTYGNAYFGDLTVAEREGRLHLVIGPRQVDYVLQPWDGNDFVFPLSQEVAPPGSLSGVSFGVDAQGAVTSLTIEFYDAAGLGTFVRR